MTQHRLCKLGDIDDPGSRGFSIETGRGTLELFVIKTYGKVVAYRNSCPHTGVSLDWMPHRFLDLDQTFIICGTHGALFQIDNGLCVSGPCLGQKLVPVAIKTVNEEVIVIEI